MCYNAISPPNGSECCCCCCYCFCCCCSTNPNSIVRAKRQKGRLGKRAKPKYEQQQQQRKGKAGCGGRNNTRKHSTGCSSSFPIGSAIRFLRVGLSSVVIMSACACVRVCVLVCAHLHPPLAAESAKQRLRQRRRRQFVSCFPSADAAALATHERSSVVVIREAHSVSCKL